VNDGTNDGANDGPGEAAPANRPRFGGFIHVPWPGSGDTQSIGPQSSSPQSSSPQSSSPDTAPDLDTQVEAIRIAIRVTLAAGGRDARLPGGTID
jgi:hypothetical protein